MTPSWCATELPDWALTAYACGGESALRGPAQHGLLDRGEYRCPRCGGSGVDVIRRTKNGSTLEQRCRECEGCGVVVVHGGPSNPGLDIPDWYPAAEQVGGEWQT